MTAIRSGPARLDEPVAWIDDQPVTMLSRWPVRDPRPFGRRLDPSTPLITGQRAIDVLFPVARGGAATIPGGFGTGKTVLQQALAKWAHADVVVYVGCGERGNELTEVLQRVPRAHRPAHRRLADGAHDPDREHLEHAGRRPRGVDLHRDHASRSTSATRATTSR